MAARVTKIRHDENTRQKIQVAQIVNRLSALIRGEIEMPPHAVTAALGLLKKALPDLQSVEISGEVKKTYVARMPAKQHTIEQWQKNYQAPSTTTTQ